jgi:hypothetical protein
MPTITGVTPNPAGWGSNVTINGSGFNGTVSVPGAQPIVRLSSVTNPLSIVASGPNQIIASLPPSGTTADGAHSLTVTSADGLATSAPSSLTVNTLPLVFTAQQVGPTLVLTSTAGGFGVQGSNSSVVWDPTGANITFPIVSWSDQQVIVSIPSSATGTHLIQVNRSSGTPGTLTFTITAVNSGTGPTDVAPTVVLAAPNPSDFGQRLKLLPLGGTFGPAGPTGAVTIGDGASFNAPLDVVSWTDAEIDAWLPSPSPRPTGTSFTITVQRLSGSTAAGPVALQAGIGQVNGIAGKLPPLNLDSIFQLDPSITVRNQLIEAAAGTASIWRYQYLKEQAINAAEKVRGLETQVLTLMQMALGKIAAGEEVLNPALLAVITGFQEDIQSLDDLSQSADVNSILNDLANAATQQLLLEALIAWLIQTDAIQFWIGLFDVLIDDVCSFDGNASHTHSYLNSQFDNLVIGGQSVQDLANQLIGRLDAELDAFAAPLRQAVASVISGTASAMAEVMSAFDLPLVERASSTPGGADVPDGNPLQQVSDSLQQALDRLIASMKQRMNTLLSNINQLRSLFVNVVFIFIVVPILAILAVGIAGGPFDAAVLAGAVLIGVEELIHLVVSWLSGPLLQSLDEAKKKVGEIVGKLEAVFGREANLIQSTSGAPRLSAAAGELRGIKDLLPEAYLDAVAQLLESARDVILRNAIKLALAAEQALGQENGTAFDTIAFQYTSGLPAAPLLPGANDPGLFASAALVRDLGKLDDQQTQLLDGKAMEVTQRLSLLNLMGGDRATFLQFLASGRALLDLREEVMLDRKLPGLYRALIQEVRVSALFGEGTLSPATGIPVAITHLGPSFTRIKRGANPVAPPLQLSPCVAGGPDFLIFLLNRRFHFPPFPIIPPHTTARDILRDALSDWERRNPHFLDLGFGPQISLEIAYEVWAEVVPGVLGEHVRRACPDVDATVVVEGARAVLEYLRTVVESTTNPGFNQILPPGLLDAPAKQLFGVTFFSTSTVLADAVNLVATVLQNGIQPGFVSGDTFSAPGYDQTTVTLTVGNTTQTQTAPGTIRDAWAQAKFTAEEHIGKWGKVTVTSDPNPDVSAAGFDILERDFPQETQMFELYPGVLGPEEQSQQAIAARELEEPLGTGEILQYRPFENRGLAGQFLITLPGVEAALPGTSDLIGSGFGSNALPVLEDLILEITFRACHNDKLAAAVVASQAQSRDALSLASQSTTLLTAGTLPVLTVGNSALQTAHFSLRGHRNRTLLAWQAAKQQDSGVILPVDPTKISLLARNAPFTPLSAVGSSATYQFKIFPANLPASTNVSTDLTTLEHLIKITLDDFGNVDTSTLANLQIVQMSLALIPMGSGVRSTDLSSDPLGAVVAFDAAVPSSVQGAGASTLGPLITPRLLLAPAATGGPLLGTAIDPSNGTGLQLTLPNPELIYDAILSVSYQVPAIQAELSTTEMS